MDEKKYVFAYKIADNKAFLNYIFSPLTFCVLDGYLYLSEHNFLPYHKPVLHGIA